MTTGPVPPGAGRLTRYLYLAALLIVLIRVALGSWIGVGIYSDSLRYRVPADPLTVFGLHGGRGPGFLLQAVFLLPSWFALLVQLVIIGLGWGLVSLIAAGLVTRIWLRVFAFTAVQVWSFLPFVLIWDTALMTEGLSIAATVAMVGCLFFLPMSELPQHLTRSAYPIALVWAFVALATRPQLVVFVLPVLLAHAALFSGLPDTHVNGWAVGAAFGMAAAAIAVTLAGSDRNEGWYAQNRLALRADAQYLEMARAAGMPECPGLPAALGDARAVRALDCPDLQAWFEQGGLSPQREFLMAPGQTLASYRADFPSQWAVVLLDREDGGPVLLNERSSEATRSLMDALLRWTTIVSGLAAASTAIVSLVRRRTRQGALPLAIAVAVTVAGLAYLYSSWALDAMEVTRHAIPISLIAAPTAWLIVLLTMNDRVRGRR